MTDLLHSVGRRTERLLYVGAILSVICASLFFVFSAADHIRGEALSEVLEKVITCLDEDKVKEATTRFEINKKLKIETTPGNYFHLLKCDEIRPTEWFGEYSLYDEIVTRINQMKNSSPTEIRENLKTWRIEVKSRPARFYEIEIPSEIAIEIAGNKITSPLTGVLAILRIALVPIVFLWAVGLYSTRSHEIAIIRTLTSGSALSYASTFPHLLNSYPLIDDLPRKKKRSTLGASIVSHATMRFFSIAIVLAAPTVIFPLVLLGIAVESSSQITAGLLLVSATAILASGLAAAIQEVAPPATEIYFVERKYSTNYHN